MREREKRVPSLLDPESMGGDIAMTGFDFQMDLILCKLPYWLSFEGFTSLICEGIADGEAKFFLPGEGFKTELVQVKNYSLSKRQFWEVIESFREIDQDSPEMYRWFTLCCSGVAKEIEPLKNGLRRLRRSQEFYKGTKIYDRSYEDYKERVLNLGKDESMAKFLFEKVLIETDWSLLSLEGESLAESVAKSVFQNQLTSHFPFYRNFLSGTLDKVYVALKELLRKNRARPISRIQIERTIQEVIEGECENPPVPQYPIIVTTGEGVKQEIVNKGILIDCSAFFGGAERKYPPKEEWNSKLVKNLMDTKEWMRRHRNTQHIRLEGKGRLSVAFAIGFVFSEVEGFTIEVEHQGDIWTTSHHPTGDTPDYSFAAAFRKGAGDRLVVAISITPFNIVKAVKTFLEKENLCDLPVLHLYSSRRVLPDQANLVVDEIKKNILEATEECGAKQIDLFYAGPATIALFLGHRWNPIPAVQCYEYIGRTEKYVPSCFLKPGATNIPQTGMNAR